jgi:hypothetical protein
MTSQSPTNRELLLRAHEVRALIRSAHNVFTPDHMARTLRDRFLEPYEQDAAELVGLLDELSRAARERLDNEGIEPPHNEQEPLPRFSKRERESISNLAILLSALSTSLLVTGERDRALAVAEEGLVWGRLSGDHLPQTLQWMTIFAIHERAGHYEEHHCALRRTLESARAAGSPLLITESLSLLIGGLIRAGLDSKETASILGLETEGLKALRKRLRKGLGIDHEASLEQFLAGM